MALLQAVWNGAWNVLTSRRNWSGTASERTRGVRGHLEEDVRLGPVRVTSALPSWSTSSRRHRPTTRGRRPSRTGSTARTRRRPLSDCRPWPRRPRPTRPDAAPSGSARPRTASASTGFRPTAAAAAVRRAGVEEDVDSEDSSWTGFRPTAAAAAVPRAGVEEDVDIEERSWT